MTTLKPAEGGRWVAGRHVPGAVDPLAGRTCWACPPSTGSARCAGRRWRVGRGGGAARPGASAQARCVLRALARRRTVRWLGEAPSALPGPWFGGMRFPRRRGGSALGADFGFARWTLPEVLVWREGRAWRWRPSPPRSPAARTWCARGWRGWRVLPGGVPPPERGRAWRCGCPVSRADFEGRVERARGANCRSGALQKVVLARAVEVEGRRPSTWWTCWPGCASRTRAAPPSSSGAPDGTAFLGATPETLCRVEGRGWRRRRWRARGAGAGRGAGGQRQGSARARGGGALHPRGAAGRWPRGSTADAEPALLAPEERGAPAHRHPRRAAAGASRRRSWSRRCTRRRRWAARPRERALGFLRRARGAGPGLVRGAGGLGRARAGAPDGGAALGAGAGLAGAALRGRGHRGGLQRRGRVARDGDEEPGDAAALSEAGDV